MHLEDRLIHFSTELIHPPRPHPKPLLQKLYFELSQTRAGYDNTDFTLPGQGRFTSRRGRNTHSFALFLPDRIALVEEWADMPLSDFLQKIREVLSRAFDILGLDAFSVQVATLRSTFSLTHFNDARVFLLERVCGQAGRIAPHMPRPIGVAGLRFVFPQTPDHPGEYHVAMESFRHNPAEILVEVKAVYPDAAIGSDDLDRACSNISDARAFISRHVFPFLNQYDLPAEEG